MEVTIRIRIADYELEVTGPKKWAEEQIKKFIAGVKKENATSYRNNKSKEKPCEI